MVKHIDWRARRVGVEPSDAAGSTRWVGSARGLSYALARAHCDVLADHDPEVVLSRRACAMLAELRDEHSFIDAGAGFTTCLVRCAVDPPRWWTFAGSRANASLAAGLADLVDPAGSVNGLRF